ncbi:MAG: dihydroneopterin aldolase [Dehalococcoidia bacterium]|nr:dihydroneopterin aldolase [Dehalococcoidia bacterium]
MTEDKIVLMGMVFYGFHGVAPAEKELGQRFIVDVELNADLAAGGATDDLSRTVNYSAVYKVVKLAVEGPSLNLIEAVAARIARDILAQFVVERVRVSVKKPEVPMKGSVLSYVAVEIVRARTS